MSAGKHAPNSSEPSRPHTSKDHPEKHVDMTHFGSKGDTRSAKEEIGTDHTYLGSDDSAISLGEQAEELRNDD